MPKPDLLTRRVTLAASALFTSALLTLGFVTPASATPVTPTIISLSPTTGDIAGGTTVVITGTDFTGTPSVAFDGVPATSVAQGTDATNITAVTPAHAAGAVDVTVTTVDADGAASATATNAFTFVGAPPTPTVTAGHVSADLSQVYPYVDGYADSTTITGSADTNTGTAIGGTGSIIVRNAAGTVVASKAFTSSASQSLTWNGRTGTKDVAGTFDATYTFAGTDGVPVSETTQIFVDLTKSLVAGLDSSVTTVYPHKDGYRDATRITYQTQMSTDQTTRGTGSVRITKSGKLVKSWSIKSSKQASVVWNGLYNGKISAGTYTATYRFVGPEGPAKSASVHVKVSSKRVVSVLHRKTLHGSAVYRDCNALDPFEDPAYPSIGDSFDPCDSGDLTGSHYGERLYSSGSGDTMLVNASIPMTTKASKWRLIFTRAGGGDAVFTYHAVEGDGTDTSTWRARTVLPNPGYPGRSVPTKWSANDQEGVASFNMGSLDWGSFYFRDIVLEYYTKELR
jgi:hypothetical protein